METRQLADRVRQLEARWMIEELAVRYCLEVDDRNAAGVAALFVEDGRILTHQGLDKGTGRSGIEANLLSRFPAMGPTNHFVHGHVITFDPDDSTQATGIVSSHAESIREGEGHVVALRYLDKYSAVDGAWYFKERVQSYFYYVSVSEYPTVLASHLRFRLDRNNPLPADWGLWSPTASA